MTDHTRRSVIAGSLALGAVSAPALAKPNSSGLLLSTRLGRVQGVSEDGVRVFKGIRYATAERFRAPRMVQPWKGIYDATKFGAAAMQNPANGAGLLPTTPMSEDCLFLNIWAPTTPGPHPVMVWLHPSGNVGGSGALEAYNSHAFARDGVVGVTINWRLGSFGFLELGHVLPEYAGSGNNGLRDAIMALRWVQANIADYGGDPTRVTLGGGLGGSRNVMALLASPESEGLFHRAMAISTGAHLCHTPEAARTMANLTIDASGGDPRTLLTMPAADVIKAQGISWSLFQNAAPFRSMVDGKLLPKLPADMFRTGAGRQIPLLFGTVHDEAPSITPDAAWKKPFPIAAEDLQLPDVATINDIDLRYQRVFPNMKPLDRRFRLVNGNHYWISCLRAAEARAANKAETYMYRFDRVLTEGKYTGYTISGMDMPYQFETLGRGEVVPTEGAKFTPADFALSRTIHTSFVNFIKGGPPSAPGLPAWPTYDLPRRATMILNHQSKVEDDPLKEERMLWSDFLT
ncbi:MAG: carboxylesterase family protein [Alphaproteobacteria bacterium]